MKALVYLGASQLEIQEIAEPQRAAPDEVIVRVDSACICGSDMHAYLGHDERRPAPCVLGHEVAGYIEDAGNCHMAVGTRVTVNPLITCGVCAVCRDGHNNLCARREIISMPPRGGAFAERLVVPGQNLVAVPDGIAMAKAALTEPLACGWHAVRIAIDRLSQDIEDCRCLILGGGAIGLGAALVLTRHRAQSIEIAETNPLRRQALTNAVDGDLCTVFDPLDIRRCPEPSSVDLVIDAAGFVATREAACRYMKPGAVMVHIGLAQAEGGLDIRRMTLQELTCVGAYTYTHADFCDTAEAVFQGELGRLDWVEQRPFAQGKQAFADLLEGRVGASKIVLTMQ